MLLLKKKLLEHELGQRRTKNKEYEWEKQGWIHCYPCHVRVETDSDEAGQKGIWAGAVMQKSPVKAEKAATDRPTV